MLRSKRTACDIIGRKIVLTCSIVEGADVYHSWADTKEENTLILILGVEFSSNQIHGSFRDGVQSTSIDCERIDHLDIRHSAGDADGLLDGTLEQKGDECGIKMNVANNVDIDKLVHVGGESLWIILVTVG